MMQTNKSVGLIAGNGNLPVELSQIIQTKGHDLQVIALKEEATPEISEFNPQWCSWGQIGKIINLLKDKNCQDVILVGGVNKRPNFSSIIGDFGTIKRIPKILTALKGSDNTVLLGVIQIFEEEGLKIVGIQEYAPELLIGSGILTQTKLNSHLEPDISIAVNVPNNLGYLILDNLW